MSFFSSFICFFKSSLCYFSDSLFKKNKINVIYIFKMHVSYFLSTRLTDPFIKKRIEFFILNKWNFTLLQFFSILLFILLKFLLHPISPLSPRSSYEPFPLYFSSDHNLLDFIYLLHLLSIIYFFMFILHSFSTKLSCWWGGEGGGVGRDGKLQSEWSKLFKIRLKDTYSLK